MKTNSLIIILLVIMISLSLKGNAAVSIKNLKSTITEQPSLPGKVTALFSWQMQTVQRNQVQTAYQVLVSETQDQLKTSKGIEGVYAHKE